jgi:hypothetical protein
MAAHGGGGGGAPTPVRSCPHWMRCAYSMQCAALRGVSASVHSGKLVYGGQSAGVYRLGTIGVWGAEGLGLKGSGFRVQGLRILAWSL